MTQFLHNRISRIYLNLIISSSTAVMMQPSCIGLQNPTTFDCSSILDNSRRTMNRYSGKNFFENKNYQAIIDCLNGGYPAAMALRKSMEEQLELRQENTNGLTSWSKKCIARLNKQSSLATYNTTMTVELNTYRMFQKQAETEQESCEALRSVINNFTEQINAMFPKKRFSITPQHRQANTMKDRFEQARFPLKKALNKLVKLRKNEKKLLHATNNRTVASKNSDFDSTTNKTQNKLEKIRCDIAGAEGKRKVKEEKYIADATDIFKQCQQFEKERLDLMKKTLIDFIQAIHPAKHSTALVEIYEQLIFTIENQQNSLNDLHYWATTYGIHNLTTTKTLETNQTENEDGSDSAIGDVDEDNQEQ